MVQKNKSKSISKRYVAIVKIGNNADATALCVKYRFNDLLKFTAFLDKKWPQWRWFNVYSNCGTNKTIQLANFTNKNRPTQRRI
jgi:ABC-type sulfate transport system substrate-binding protein